MAAKQQAEKELEKYELAAWQGWQGAIATGNYKEGFSQWREALGLDIFADRVLNSEDAREEESKSADEIMGDAYKIIEAAKEQGLTTMARERWERKQKLLEQQEQQGQQEQQPSVSLDETLTEQIERVEQENI